MPKTYRMSNTLRDAQKWREKKQTVYQKFEGKCAYCGIEIDIETFQIDHLISKHEGACLRQKGIYINVENLSNLYPACFSCNNYKRAHSLETFRSEISQQIRRLRRDQPTFRLAERYGLISCNEDVTIQFFFEKEKYA